MCTVIYIPNKNGFLISSCRDESPGREPAVKPSIHSGVLSPVLTSINGTWIGLKANSEVIVLLNGGFVKHISTGNYTKSRGQIGMEALQSKNAFHYWQTVNLWGVEPFTLVFKTLTHLQECVWDGQNKHEKLYPLTKARIWSSSTLYTTEQKAEREAFFFHYLSHQEVVNKEGLLNLLYKFENGQFGFVMNRNEVVKTVSISLIEKHKTDLMFEYHDLLSLEKSVKGFEKNAIGAKAMEDDLY